MLCDTRVLNNSQLRNKQPNFKMGKEILNRHYSNEGIQRANKNLRKFSPFLSIRLMQIKSNMKYHLIHVRMHSLQNTKVTGICENAEQ